MVSTMEADIAAQFRDLLEHFIVVRFERDEVENAPRLEELRNSKGRPPPSGRQELWTEVGDVLLEIGDGLDQDEELQRYNKNPHF